MSQHKKHLSIFKNIRKFVLSKPKTQKLLIILIFASIATVLLATTFASSKLYLFEAENGNLSVGTSIKTDGSALSGSFVEFGKTPQTCDGLRLCTIVDNSTNWDRWINTGPGGGGYFMSSSIGPDGSLLVGSDLGGAFYSNNNGASWRQIGVNQGYTQTHTPAVAHHPVNENIIFLSSSSSGLYRSTDAGLTNTKVISSGRICGLGIGETVAYASVATNWNEDCKEVMVSTDNGQTWTSKFTLPDNSHVLNIRVSKADNNNALFISGKGRFFSAGAKKVWQSNDQATNLTELTIGYSSFDANWSEDGQTVYVTTDETDTVNTSLGRLMKKDVSLSANLVDVHASRTGMIWIPAGTTNTLRLVDRNAWGPWLVNEGMFESTDNGVTFTKISSIGSAISSDHEWGWTTATWAYSHRDIKEWNFSSTDPNKAFYTTNQFGRASFDGGRSFKEMSTYNQGTSWSSTGLDNTVPFTIKQHPLDSNFIVAGYADLGCWRSLDGGLSWEGCNQDGFTGSWNEDGGNVRTVVQDPDDINKVWITNGLGSSHYLLKSASKAAKGSWTELTTGLPSGAVSFDDLILDESSPAGNRTLFMIVNGDVYKSTDDGSSWTSVLDCNDCWRLAIDQESNTVLAGGNTSIWHSTTNGDSGSWSSFTLPGYSNSSSSDVKDSSYTGITDIMDEPDSTGIFWITAKGTNGGVFRYDTGTAVLKHSNIYARTVSVEPSSKDIFFGSSSAFYSGGYNSASTGLSYSSDNGTTWQTLDSAMNFPLVTGVYFPKNSSNMWIMNPGLGFFRVD